MKTMLPMCLFVVSQLVPVASAVTVDLSSPQEGVILAPKDSFSLTLVVGNDSDEPDLIVAVLDVVGKGAIGNLPGISHKPIRIPVGPGLTVTKTFELVMNKYKLLPAGEYVITISVAVKGVISGTLAEDTITLLLVK